MARPPDFDKLDEWFKDKTQDKGADAFPGHRSKRGHMEAWRRTALTEAKKLIRAGLLDEKDAKEIEAYAEELAEKAVKGTK